MTTTTTPNSSESKAEQAKGQAQHVASVAGDEAKSVTSDVRQQARGLVDETKTQVEDQSRQQRDRLVTTVRSFSDDLEEMSNERSGMASDVMREVAQRARSIGDSLDGREPAELLDDLRSFARRRPGMFLAGSLVAGVLVGRIVRGGREAAKNDSGSTGSYDGSYGSTGGTYGFADTGATSGVPAYEPPPGTMGGAPTSGVSAGDPLSDPLIDPNMPVEAPSTPHREVP